MVHSCVLIRHRLDWAWFGGQRMIYLIVAIQIGWASQYDPGVMQRVIQVQQRYGHLSHILPSVDGYVAVSNCKLLGGVLLLRPTGSEPWERFLITDCAGSDETREWMLRNNILVEVDHETALRWNTVGRGIRIEVGRKVKLLRSE